MSASGEIQIGTTACLERIAQALISGSAIIDKIKQRHLDPHTPPHPLAPEIEIQYAWQDIEKEKSEGVTQFGKAFEDGDHIAVIALQQVVIELQSRLLETLRDVTFGAQPDQAGCAQLQDAAVVSRDTAILALHEFKQRLQGSMGEGPGFKASGALTFDTATATAQQAARRKSAEATMTASQLSSRPNPGTRTRAHTRDSGDVSTDTDPATSTDDTLSHGRKRHSLLQFLKNHRTHSATDTKPPPLAALHSQQSIYGSSDEPKASTASLALPLRPPAQCDASTPSMPPSQSPDDDLPPDYKATLERREFAVHYHDASPPPRPSSPLFTTHPPTTTLILTPTPENNYLGFCKSAWKLQNGDRRGSFAKSKDAEPWSRHPSSHAASAQFLACTHHKCAFRSSFSNPSVDVIWDKVFTIESKGLKFRWPFFAKSHTLQRVVIKYQYAFQCLFCVLLGAKAQVFQGMEAYLDHVCTEHRGQSFGDVLLYKTGCISDRVARDEEEFDVNLFPLNFEVSRDRNKSLSDDVLGDSLANADASDSHLVPNEPWNEGLSEFHYGGELDRTELA